MKNSTPANTRKMRPLFLHSVKLTIL